MTRGEPCGTDIWPLRHRATLTIEIDGGTGGIDGPIKVTPTALHANIGLIDPPGFVRRLEMTAQPLFQCGTVTLNPTPDRRVIRGQTALGEQLFDIAERERVPKIPAHGTKNQLWCRLPPLEDCRSGCMLHGLVRLPTIPAKVATHPPAQLPGPLRSAPHAPPSAAGAIILASSRIVAIICRNQ